MQQQEEQQELLPFIRQNIQCNVTKDDTQPSIIIKCSSLIKNIKNWEPIGEGTYGKVFKAVAVINLNKSDCNILTDNSDDCFREYGIAVKFTDIPIHQQLNEAKFNQYASKYNIAPHTFETFYYVSPEYEQTLVQVIISEPFDTNLYHILATNNILNLQQKYDICTQASILIFKCIYTYNLICIDQKPQNFVYRRIDNKVRMIDLDNYYCTFNSNNKLHRDTKLVIVSVLLLQMYFLSALSIFNSITDNDYTNMNILQAFTQQKLFPKEPHLINNVVILLKKYTEIRKMFSYYVFLLVDTSQVTPNDITYETILDIVELKPCQYHEKDISDELNKYHKWIEQNET